MHIVKILAISDIWSIFDKWENILMVSDITSNNIDKIEFNLIFLIWSGIISDPLPLNFYDIREHRLRSKTGSFWNYCDFMITLILHDSIYLYNVLQKNRQKLCNLFLKYCYLSLDLTWSFSQKLLVKNRPEDFRITNTETSMKKSNSNKG